MRITGEFPDVNRQKKSREGIVHLPDMGPRAQGREGGIYEVRCIGGLGVFCYNTIYLNLRLVQTSKFLWVLLVFIFC